MPDSMLWPRGPDVLHGIAKSNTTRGSNVLRYCKTPTLHVAYGGDIKMPRAPPYMSPILSLPTPEGPGKRVSTDSASQSWQLRRAMQTTEKGKDPNERDRREKGKKGKGKGKKGK